MHAKKCTIGLLRKTGRDETFTLWTVLWLLRQDGHQTVSCFTVCQTEQCTALCDQTSTFIRLRKSS